MKDEIGDICLESDTGSQFKEQLVYPASKCPGANGEEESIVSTPAALHTSTSHRKPRGRTPLESQHSHREVHHHYHN